MQRFQKQVTKIIIKWNNDKLEFIKIKKLFFITGKHEKASVKQDIHKKIYL